MSNVQCQALFLWYEQGEYSDYTVEILGAYSTLDTANKAARREEERLYQLEMQDIQEALTVTRKANADNVNLGLFIDRIEERRVRATAVYDEWKTLCWQKISDEPETWELTPTAHYGRTYIAKLFTLDAIP